MVSKVEDLQEQLLAWLGSDQGYAHLLTIAASLLREAGANGSLSVIWPYPLLQSDSFEKKMELTKEVAHDFYLFCVDFFLLQLPKHPELIHAVENGRSGILFEYARKKFLWQWKEKARNKEINPCGYLYRRLRETLSGAPQFETGREANGAFLYRLRDNDQEKEFVQTVFQEEIFSSWPLLPDNTTGAPEKAVFKTDYIIKAALFFWEEAKRKTTVQAIAARDLNRYIISQHPWLLIPDAEEERDISYEQDTESLIDYITTVPSFVVLAEQLVAAWSHQQCEIFLLRLEEPPVSLKVIAEKFGWPNHNKVHRLFSSCRESLITLSSNWPGPPLAELPELCSVVFLDNVKMIAKKRITARKEQ